MPTLLLIILAACDPIIEIQADVAVGGRLQDELPDYPYELVLHTVFDGRAVHDRLAVLCEPGANVSAVWYAQAVACGEATQVEAWLAPLSDDTQDCGLAPDGTPATTMQTWGGDTPYISRTAFNEANGKCNQSYRDHLEMALQEP